MWDCDNFQVRLGCFIAEVESWRGGSVSVAARLV